MILIYLFWGQAGWVLRSILILNALSGLISIPSDVIRLSQDNRSGTFLFGLALDLIGLPGFIRNIVVKVKRKLRSLELDLPDDNKVWNEQHQQMLDQL